MRFDESKLRQLKIAVISHLILIEEIEYLEKLMDVKKELDKGNTIDNMIEGNLRALRDEYARYGKGSKNFIAELFEDIVKSIKR